MSKHYLAETLTIDGPDAVAFAHAQFSSNVAALAIGKWQFSAWLDAQGRVRAFFHLARLADHQLLILLRGGSASATVEALQRFVFRSKLKLIALPTRTLVTGPALPMHDIGNDNEDVLLGCDNHSLCLSSHEASDDAWRLAQLRWGWPWLPDSLLNELLPPALSLQRLHAVVVDKGCYPGQEIVARMHFRGAHKKHLHRVELSRTENSGESLRIDKQEKGYLLDVFDKDDSIDALAVLNDDVVAQAVDGKLGAFDNGLMMHLRERWNA